MLTVTLKCAHKNISEVCARGVMSSLIKKKEKNEKKKNCFPLTRLKTIFPILGALQKLKITFSFKFSFWRMFFEVKERIL